MRNGVYILNKKVELKGNLTFEKNQEFEIVGSIVYINGYPLPIEMQKDIYTWMNKNSDLFTNDTRDY